LKVLNYTRWHKKRAAEILGINASTLYRKLQAYGMLKGTPVEEDEKIAA
jgi:DNA-binding protein Fis